MANEEKKTKKEKKMKLSVKLGNGGRRTRIIFSILNNLQNGNIDTLNIKLGLKYICPKVFIYSDTSIEYLVSFETNLTKRLALIQFDSQELLTPKPYYHTDYYKWLINCTNYFIQLTYAQEEQYHLLRIDYSFPFLHYRELIHDFIYEIMKYEEEQKKKENSFSSSSLQSFKPYIKYSNLKLYENFDNKVIKRKFQNYFKVFELKSNSTWRFPSSQSEQSMMKSKLKTFKNIKKKQKIKTINSS